MLHTLKLCSCSACPFENRVFTSLQAERRRQVRKTEYNYPQHAAKPRHVFDHVCAADLLLAVCVTRVGLAIGTKA